MVELHSQGWKPVRALDRSASFPRCGRLEPVAQLRNRFGKKKVSWEDIAKRKGAKASALNKRSAILALSL